MALSWILRRGLDVRVLKYEEFAFARRDIVYAIHECSFCDSIGSALDRNLFGLPYWEYLETRHVERFNEALFREGSLLVILAMCQQYLLALGDWFSGTDRLRHCLDAVSNLNSADWIYDDADLSRLVEVTFKALELVKMDGTDDGEFLEREADWARERYVAGYLGERARACRDD